MTAFTSDIEIANAAQKRHIKDLAHEHLGLAPEQLEPYGHYKAKLPLNVIDSIQDRPEGRLILVTAMTPTTAGEGKTTTSVGLCDGLNHIGKKSYCCPSGTESGTLFRNERRCRRGRLRPSGADGRYQFAFYR